MNILEHTDTDSGSVEVRSCVFDRMRTPLAHDAPGPGVLCDNDAMTLVCNIMPIKHILLS